MAYDPMVVTSAPWTSDEVRSLSDFQIDSHGGCYSCVNRCGPLSATSEGLTCKKCKFKFPYALSCHLDWRWKDVQMIVMNTENFDVGGEG